MCGGVLALYSSSSDLPMSYEVNATGTLATNGVSFASRRLPLSTAVRPGLPSLKITTPDACAFWALITFTPKLQPPRWISAMLPGVKPAKSSGEQPFVELDVAVGGIARWPVTGCTSASASPLLLPGFQSVWTVNERAVGEVSLHVGVPTNDEYSNVYGWSVTL